jgi:orotate phosphoribosyltransferase
MAMTTPQKVAQAIIKIQAINFVPNNPITFKSGIVSPIYIDNRKFPFHPNEWQSVIEGFAEIIQQKSLKQDVVAGVLAAGVPHSAALGYFTKIPSVFVRKEAKDHGTKKLVEGGNIKGKKVLLVEDLVSTGVSSLNAVEALRSEGAEVTDCLVIVTYGFEEARKAFQEKKVQLHALTTFPVILDEAKKEGIIDAGGVKIIEDWLQKYSK